MAKKKTTATSKQPKRRRGEALVGCAFGAADCDGERVHDWPRAVSEAGICDGERVGIVKLVKRGRLRLCDDHRRHVNRLLDNLALPLSGPVDAPE